MNKILTFEPKISEKLCFFVEDLIKSDIKNTENNIENIDNNLREIYENITKYLVRAAFRDDSNCEDGLIHQSFSTLVTLISEKYDLQLLWKTTPEITNLLDKANLISNCEKKEELYECILLALTWCFSKFEIFLRKDRENSKNIS